MLGQSEFAARLTQAIDHFDGYDVSWPHVFVGLRDVAVNDLFEIEQLPQPTCEPNVAKTARPGPADRAESNADDISIVSGNHTVIIGEKPELFGIALAVVKDDRPLPTAFLFGIEFPQIRHNALPRPRAGANRLHEREVRVRLAILATAIAAEKHWNLLVASMAKKAGKKQGGRFPLHRQNGVSTTKKPGNLQETGPKIVVFFKGVRNLG
jgi:hypothetical protein